MLNDRAARQREAGARAREAEGKVEEALEAAKPGLRDGNPADLVLLAAAQRIEAQLASGAVGPEVRRRGEQLLRDVRVLATLDEARLTGSQGRYEAAFRMYGIDVPNLDQPQAAARIRASAIREALLAGLDAWMEIMPNNDAQRADLRRVADAADDNAWRRAFREAALAPDNDKLKALAAQPEALAQPPAVLDRLGSVLMARNLRGEALAVWRQAQQRHPADFWINYNLGNALHSPPGEPSGKEFVLSNTEALSYCRAAAAIRPGSKDALNLLGAVLVVTGDLDAALVACQQAHALYPPSPHWHFPSPDLPTDVMLGDALRKRGRRDEAIACYKWSIELNLYFPQAPRTHRKLLEVLKEQGKLDEAIAFDKKLIEPTGPYPGMMIHVGPMPYDWPMPYRLLLDALKEQGKLDEGIAEYQATIRAQPHNLFGHLLFGEALLYLGHYKEAEAEYREAIRIFPDNGPAHNELGNALYRQGRYKDAEAEYREAIRLTPEDPVVHDNLGDTLSNQGRHEKAAAAFSEAIRLQPENGWYWVRRGWVYADLGQWEKASADFVKATKCKQPDQVAWYSRAMLCLRDGDLDDYRKVCADMLERFAKSDDAVSLGWLAWTCVLAPNAGVDPAQLVSLAERASGKPPEDLWGAIRIGAALYRAGRFDEAVKRLNEATALDADPSRTNMLCTWFFLAMAHRRLGHADEARRWLEKATRATEEALKPPAEPPGKSAEPSGAIPPSWKGKLTLQLLHREAEEQIQGPGGKPGK
jgi:tetratricopeptide (TPR) repeat protein